jgi:hypothetical protein
MYYYDPTNVDLTFDNRIDALKYSINNNTEIRFCYKDDEFNEVNWKQEPKESLAQLYKERAQWIRDNYDYVVLCYSGGIDSTNMLESFYNNGIHIDEIVSVGSFSQDKSDIYDVNHNKEIYENVIPTLNGFNLPNTKKTIIDYTEYFRDLNNFSMYQKYGSDYYKYIGVYTSVTYLFWYDIGKFINPKGKTAILLAVEKPYIKYDTDLLKFYTQFDDASISNYCNYEFNNVFRVNFYTDPGAEKIMRKQAHLIKNYFIDLAVRTNTPIESQISNNYLETIKPIIYNVKNPLKYVAGKSSNQFLSCRDTYIIDNKNSDVYKLYKDMIFKLKNDLDLSNKRYTTFTNMYYIT